MRFIASQYIGKRQRLACRLFQRHPSQTAMRQLNKSDCRFLLPLTMCQGGS